MMLDFKYLNENNDHILVMDNLIDDVTSENIKQELVKDTFNWFISEGPLTVSKELYEKNSDDKTFDYYQFSHNFIKDDGSLNSVKIDLIKILVEKLQTHFKCEFRFNRIKANLQTEYQTNLVYNTAHRDQYDANRDHIVVIYYVNDSDGKTFIFDNDERPWTIKKEIESKQGRFLIFNGKHHHSGNHPKKGIRMVINFNIVGVENFL